MNLYIRRYGMWAQLIKARVKEGRLDEVMAIQKEIADRGRDGSIAWVRSIGLQNENDPGETYTLVFFESEEKARATEQSPEQQAMVKRLQACFEGPPEFVDLNPIYDVSR